MSVRSEPYLIVGYRLSDKYKNDENEDFDKFADFQFPWCGKNAKNTYGILVDGVTGIHVIAGFCIDCGVEDVGLSLNEITPEKLKNYQKGVDDWLEINNLNQYKEGEFKLFALTHYH